MAGPPPLAQPSPSRRAPPLWLLLLVPAVTLLVGAVAGFSLGATHARRQPASPSLTSLPVTTGPPAPPATRVVIRRYASPACLETARRGDELIDRLIRNQRRAAEDLLVLYTVAARQCRKDATPTP